MAPERTTNLLTGVIEGFYGVPWTPAERFELFDWMKAWGLNTYLYAPKDDLKHRVLWRELYTRNEAEELAHLIRAAEQHGLRLVFALGPGLDIRYRRSADREALLGRFEQMLGLGCRNFCLLFDDIPDHLDPEDRVHFGSFASAHAGLANEVFRWVRERVSDAGFLFCPTPYCGRMAQRQLGGADYLATIGRELLPEFGVFWTGPEIISREITVPHLRELQSLIRRKPVIWDNLHANDYDGHRFFCGPYAGRPLELRSEVGGLLLNPNTEFPLNFVPVRTLAAFTRATQWDPRAAYLAALQEWLPQFATPSGSLSHEDLVRLGDCYYLPYESGLEAAQLYQQVRQMMERPPAQWLPEEIRDLRERLRTFRELCVRLTELRRRPLFHALSRRIWELREELDLLDRYFQHHTDPSQAGVPFTSDFHQPETYRGGLVARLQHLLVQQPDGTFVPREPYARDTDISHA